MLKVMLLFLISSLFIGILHILNNKLNILDIDCACGFSGWSWKLRINTFHSISSSGAIWLYALQYKQPQAGDKSFYLPADSVQPAW